jgi:hypothetical protein
MYPNQKYQQVVYSTMFLIHHLLIKSIKENFSYQINKFKIFFMISKKNKAIKDLRFPISKIKTRCLKIKLCKLDSNLNIYLKNLMVSILFCPWNFILVIKVTNK